MFNLFLDDIREVEDVTWVKLPKKSRWQVGYRGFFLESYLRFAKKMSPAFTVPNI